MAKVQRIKGQAGKRQQAAETDVAKGESGRLLEKRSKKLQELEKRKVLQDVRWRSVWGWKGRAEVKARVVTCWEQCKVSAKMGRAGASDSDNTGATGQNTKSGVVRTKETGCAAGGSARKSESLRGGGGGGGGACRRAEGGSMGE